MRPHLIDPWTENQVSPPEVEVGFTIAADVYPLESVPPSPADQFGKRIREDLAYRVTLLQVQPRIVSWGRLPKKIDHDNFHPRLAPERPPAPTPSVDQHPIMPRERWDVNPAGPESFLRLVSLVLITT